MKTHRVLSLATVAWIVLVLLCGCTAAPTETPTAPTEETLQTLPTSAPVVIPNGERTSDGVKVTIHAGLLGELTEELTEQQVKDGYTAAVKNEDGSITYTIAADAYDTTVARYRADARAAILYTVEDGSYYSLKSAECAEDLSSITLHVDRALYEDSMDALMVFGTGMIAVTAQAYDVEAPGRCVIKVVDDAGATISETVYPDELIL